ncbi:hypothetical protein KFL_000550390 [Klebsormidium nitens]|uniref:Uncharacterized protein n=1 Tax=Klebsormidium nitens TaxID=105231 RepID=A0A1Y1HPF8_KLENI|nr:hypothetical protein KFL_000550390 [Klebsormidium nitens]|eukprot:GAQ80510.1 hypothetical protein KFL_000550390 [Klebsormidium nitens]
MSVERQEILIATVNARSNDTPVLRRRCCQRAKGLKHEGQIAHKVSARGRFSAADQKAKRQDVRVLKEAVNCAVERDPHAIRCRECDMTAEYGLRGGKREGLSHTSARAMAHQRVVSRSTRTAQHGFRGARRCGGVQILPVTNGGSIRSGQGHGRRQQSPHALTATPTTAPLQRTPMRPLASQSRSAVLAQPAISMPRMTRCSPGSFSSTAQRASARCQAGAPGLGLSPLPLRACWSGAHSKVW